MRIPLVILLTIPASIAYGQIYGGPSISGLPGVSAGKTAGARDGYTFFANVSGLVDGGLTPIVTDQKGDLIRYGTGYGVEAGFGVYGTHRTRRTEYGLSYVGGYRAYTSRKYFNGSDHTLGFDTSTRVSQRWQWVTNTRAATLSRPIGGWLGFGGAGGPMSDTGLGGTITDTIFDNRFYYLQHTQQGTYMASSRLSFSFGGTGVAVRRQSSALAGMDAYGANGAISYRLNARSTVSLLYDYFKIDYTQAFGGSDIHQMMAQISRSVSRRWTLNVAAGAFRVETTGLVSVKPDPAIVALFGNVNIIETFYRQKAYGAGRAELQGDYRRYSVRVGYSRTPTPGNGVYLTSVADQLNAGVSYGGIRKLSMSANVFASRYSSVGQRSLGAYITYGGGSGLAYSIGKGLSATLHGSVRQSEIHQTGGFNGVIWQVMVGVAYSSGERPLSLW